jgi:hypothetical protein
MQGGFSGLPPPCPAIVMVSLPFSLRCRLFQKGETMPKSPAIFAALGLLLAAGAGMPAMAQETDDGLGQYEIIRNGMGILKYCESSGHITAGMANEALAIYQSALDPVSSSLTPEQKAAGDAAEKHGREGLAGGPQAPDFAETARRMRTTPPRFARIRIAGSSPGRGLHARKPMNMPATRSA